MDGDADDLESLAQTVLRVGEREVTITLDDVRGMQAALLTYLGASDYPDREELLPRTKGPAWIDSDGAARIGPWLLEAPEGEMFLRYREPPGQYAGKAHVASIGKDHAGKWRVRNLVVERIRVRR